MTTPPPSNSAAPSPQDPVTPCAAPPASPTLSGFTPCILPRGHIRAAHVHAIRGEGGFLFYSMRQLPVGFELTLVGRHNTSKAGMTLQALADAYAPAE